MNENNDETDTDRLRKELLLTILRHGPGISMASRMTAVNLVAATLLSAALHASEPDARPQLLEEAIGIYSRGLREAVAEYMKIVDEQFKGGVTGQFGKAKQFFSNTMGGG